MRPTFLKNILIVAAATWTTNVCQAGAWDWASQVNLSSVWSDNPALIPDSRDPQSTFRMLGAFSAKVLYASPTSTLRFEPRVTRDYYPDKDLEDLQSTDFFLPGSYRYTRPTTNWSLGWNLSRQIVLSDEGTLSQDPDTNRLNVDDRVYRASLAPTVRWNLSEKDQIMLSINAGVTRYERELTSRADGDSYGGMLSYNRAITQRQNLGFSATSSNFESEFTNFIALPPTFTTTGLGNVQNTGDRTAFTADYGFDFSENSKFFINFGLQKSNSTNLITDLESDAQSESSFAFESTTYKFGYQKGLQRGDFTIAGSRTIQPSVNGQPQDRYDLNFVGQYDLTPRLNTKLRVVLFQQQNIILSATEGELNKKIHSLFANLRGAWRLTAKWSVIGGYTFRYRTDDRTINADEGRIARSNTVALGVGYSFKKSKIR
jgi:hypothetical protein